MTALQTLINYQAADGSLKKIESELNRTDEKKKYNQARNFLKKAQGTLTAYDNKATQLKAEIARLEALYDKTAEEISDFSEIDYAELENNESEVAYYRKHALTLSDTLRSIRKDLNAVKDQLTATEKDYSELKKQTIEMQRQYKKYRDEYMKIAEARDGEIMEIKSKMAGMESEIPPDLLKKYKEKRAEGLWPVLSAVQDRRCSGCKAELTAYATSRLTGKGYIECETCHRLMYGTNDGKS